MHASSRPPGDDAGTGPVAVLDSVAAMLLLGAAPRTAWRVADSDDLVAPLAAAGVPHRDALHAVAASRYRAWQIGPTSARAKSARNAIDAFLATEPAGSRKEQAVHWSEQLPH